MHHKGTSVVHRRRTGKSRHGTATCLFQTEFTWQMTEQAGPAGDRAVPVLNLCALRETPLLVFSLCT